MAVDRRKKNYNWNVAGEDGQTYPNMRDGCALAVLMDIRDELQKINQSLGCWRIQRMFQTIERMDKRLAKKAKLR